jgi:hypothetical protein
MPECRCRTKHWKLKKNYRCRTELFIGILASMRVYCPDPCFMTKSVLHVYVHASCPCLYYISMSMLHVHVNIHVDIYRNARMPGFCIIQSARYQPAMPWKVSAAVTWKPQSIWHCQGNFRCRNICQRSDNFKNLQKACRKVTNILILWWKDAFTSSLMIYSTAESVKWKLLRTSLYISHLKYFFI